MDTLNKLDARSYCSPRQALQKTKYEDWYWKFQVGKCYYRLGLLRDAEKMFKSALKQQEMIDVFLHLSRVRLVHKYLVND
jgi:hypothetical protein